MIVEVTMRVEAIMIVDVIMRRRARKFLTNVTPLWLGDKENFALHSFLGALKQLLF